MTLLAKSGARLVHLPEIDSTNAEAHRLALRGEQGPLWIVADRQLRGRGRRGRRWISRKGNLFATLLLTYDIAPVTAAQLSFAAALAVLETVRTLIPEASERALLKWPNDVLIDGSKVAGILVETTAPSQGNTVLAIGCGMNLAHAPRRTPYPVTCLADQGCLATRDEVFTLLADCLAKQLAAWSLGQGFEVIRQCWLARAAGLGGRAAVATENGRIEGTFANLAADGALILRLDNGEQHAVYGGEVTFAGVEDLRSGKS